DIAPEVPDVFYGDEGRITQVAINLLSNAFKFTANGTVRLEMTWENDALLMRVIDTGIGIAPHALSYIFDEFRQVDATSQRKYGGTGLGLAIVRKLCNLMGGNVNVESALGAGSIFTVTLPLHAVTPA
ncbi:MAG: hypothetical protein H7175_18475, partial [Burkholderiales bacterium]|nr:hypothetical protein [Anaerolineae bacterium]